MEGLEKKIDLLAEKLDSLQKELEEINKLIRRLGKQVYGPININQKFSANKNDLHFPDKRM